MVLVQDCYSVSKDVTYIPEMNGLYAIVLPIICKSLDKDIANEKIRDSWSDPDKIPEVNALWSIPAMSLRKSWKPSESCFFQ